MNIIANVREIADLVRRTGDIELFKKIVGLQNEIIELTKNNRRLTGQVAQLQTSLKNKDKMEYREPFYYLKGDDVPCCPRCWERDELALHMVADHERALSGLGYTCTTCKTLLFEQ